MDLCAKRDRAELKSEQMNSDVTWNEILHTFMHVFVHLVEKFLFLFFFFFSLALQRLSLQCSRKNWMALFLGCGRGTRVECKDTPFRCCRWGLQQNVWHWRRPAGQICIKSQLPVWSGGPPWHLVWRKAYMQTWDCWTNDRRVLSFLLFISWESSLIVHLGLRMI